MEQVLLMKLELTPANKAQKDFLECGNKYVLMSGAVAAGKSLLGCWKTFLNGYFNPGYRSLICRKENVSLHGSTLRTLFEQVIHKELIVHYDRSKGELIHRTIDPKHHSMIVFSGLDKGADAQYPTKIGSTEYATIFVDEGIELDEGDWQMLMTRLRYRIPFLSHEQNDALLRQMFTATNPDGPYHWMYHFFFTNAGSDKSVFYTTPYDNPYLPPDYLPALERQLTGISKERLLLGRWVQAEGIIFEHFNPKVHVVDDFGILLKHYQYFIGGADANYPLPRAGLLIGVRGDGGVDVMDEFYKRGAEIEELQNWYENKVPVVGRDILIYHDPSDPQAIDKLNRGRSIRCEKAMNAVLPGISVIGGKFKNDKIRISKKCTNLIRELLSYHWKKGGEGQTPEKENDHACFLAGTMVMTDEGLKPIENCMCDTLVLTRKGYQLVEEFMARTATDLYSLKLSSGQVIKATGDHPFYVANEGFVALRKLRKGQKLESITNNSSSSSSSRWYHGVYSEHVRVVTIKKLAGEHVVYNIRVRNVHEYYAGGVLVSNCDALRYALYSVAASSQPVIARFA